jgi:hypothetical protein
MSHPELSYECGANSHISSIMPDDSKLLHDVKNGNGQNQPRWKPHSNFTYLPFTRLLAYTRGVRHI